MRQTRMLRRLVWLVIPLVAGCNGFNLGHGWRRLGATASDQVTSEPLQVEAPASAPAAEDAANGDGGEGDTTPLAKRIEDYVNKIPSDQANREAGKVGGGLTTRPAGYTGLVAGQGSMVPVGVGHGASAVKPRSAVAMAAQPSPAPPTVGVGPVLPERQRPRVELVDIRPVVRPNLAAEAPALPAPANQPVDVLRPGLPSADVAGMIGELEESVKQHPEHVDDQLRLRLLYLATGQDDRAVGPLAGLDPGQGELLSALCRVISLARRVLQEPASASSTLGAMEDLHRLMGQRSTVTIPKMALVTRVNSFGDYDAVTPPRFAAGQPVQTFLYTEIANFRSESTADGKLRTLLSEKVEVFDSAGKVVMQRTEPAIEDRTLSPRRDFFIPFPISLPANTAPGEYILKVTIEDKIGGTIDQQRMSFTLVKP